MDFSLIKKGARLKAHGARLKKQTMSLIQSISDRPGVDRQGKLSDGGI